MSITAITFDEFLAELERATDDAVHAMGPAQQFPELFEMGNSLVNIEDFVRFDGVRQDLMREVRGGLCTLEQAVAYLKNFELHLLAEAEKSATK